MPLQCWNDIDYVTRNKFNNNDDIITLFFQDEKTKSFSQKGIRYLRSELKTFMSMKENILDFGNIKIVKIYTPLIKYFYYDELKLLFHSKNTIFRCEVCRNFSNKIVYRIDWANKDGIILKKSHIK